MGEEGKVRALAQRDKMVCPCGADFIPIHQCACLSCRGFVYGLRESERGMQLLDAKPGGRASKPDAIA